MINSVLSIIDRLIKLKNYPSVRSEKRFKEIFEPMFADLLLIHRDYIDIFDSLAQMLPNDTNSEDFIKRAVEATSFLRSRRNELEPLRYKLRALSSTMRQLKLDEKGSAFVRKTHSYLVPLESMDNFGSLLRERRYQLNDDETYSEYLRSNSMIYLRIIDNLIDAENISDGMKYSEKRAILKLRASAFEAGNELRIKWSYVCEAFAELQLVSNQSTR